MEQVKKKKPQRILWSWRDNMFDKDYKVTGIYATYWMDLCKRQIRKGENPEDYKKDNFKIFNTYMDCYKTATALGIRYGRIGTLNDPDNKDECGMLTGVMNKNRDKLIYIYQMVMLLEKERNLSEEERIENAFQLEEFDDEGNEIPENVARIKENLQLFEKYFFGGLEILHEEFVEKCTTEDDYLERIHSFTKDYLDEIQSLEEIDE